MAFNDPLSPFQWYLNATGAIAGATGQRDLGNLEAVWADYIGRNIKIGIYDSGVDISHPDLAGNYLASLNPTFNGAVLNPNPTTGAGGRLDAHGTAVAGIIAGIANNNTGIAGIAYGAKFGVGLTIGSTGGVDVSGSLIEQMRLQTNFDVVNHSWGYTAPFSSNQDAAGPQDLEFIRALSDTAANGRGGLGTIMVVSGGNGRQGDVNDQGNGLRGPNSTNDQSFENSRFVITVAAADRDGRVSDYPTPVPPCSSPASAAPARAASAISMSLQPISSGITATTMAASRSPTRRSMRPIPALTAPRRPPRQSPA